MNNKNPCLKKMKYMYFSSAYNIQKKRRKENSMEKII